MTKTTKPIHYSSGYAGIWIQAEIVEEEFVYWLVCDNGDEQYFGNVKPCSWQIDQFRDDCVGENSQ